MLSEGQATPSHCRGCQGACPATGSRADRTGQAPDSSLGRRTVAGEQVRGYLDKEGAPASLAALFSWGGVSSAWWVPVASRPSSATCPPGSGTRGTWGARSPPEATPRGRGKGRVHCPPHQVP